MMMEQENILHIKNMVCPRCIKAVRRCLAELTIEYDSISLGQVHLKAPLSVTGKRDLALLLTNEGFELLADKSSRLIEQIKSLIIGIVHYEKGELNSNLSDYLAKELLHEYNYLSRLFSSVEGITIEKYVIQQKIERIKELLLYDELTPSQIADKLHYSSLQHMSNQFKKVIGLSPRAFKKQLQQDRKSLDEI